VTGPPPPLQPGWYRDPDDPVRLRHHNGRGWDSRHRTMPAWAIGVGDLVATERSRREGDPTLEGPVQRAALAAIATGGAQSPSAAELRRPARSAAAAGAGRGNGGAAAAAHRSGGVRPALRASWPRPHGAFLALPTMLVAAVALLVATLSLANRPVTVPTLAQDASFIRSANIACGEAMGAIRLPTPPGSAATPRPAAAPSPAAVATANRDLARLAAEIHALPVVDSARSLVQGWLDDWQRYTLDRQRQADAVAAGAMGGPAGAASLTSALGFDEARANGFVTTNGLGACTLSSPDSVVPAS